MNAKNSKKGYFFIVDGLVALVVLVTGIIIMGAIFSGKPIFQPPYDIGQDILGIMEGTNISNVKIDLAPTIRFLFNDKRIEDNSSSVLQQVGKFYYTHCDYVSKADVNNAKLYLGYANVTAHKLMRNIIPNPYYGELIFSGDSKCTGPVQIYTTYPQLAGVALSQANSKTLISTRRVVFGNIGYTDTFGPYVATLNVWR